MIEYSVIGKIPSSDVVFGEDGAQVGETKYQKGWFVNTTGTTPEMDDYRIDVATPVQEFFGVETFFLRFENEKEWDSVKGDLF